MVHILRILIYGSTAITSHVCLQLEKEHKIVGYIPSESPSFPGQMHKWKALKSLPSADKYDLAISIQYDKKILNTDRCYNLHTGILPEWGGCNILYHTVRSDVREQGLTFHKITNKFDEGPIVSKITYPVLHDDDEADLYVRMLEIAPYFCLSSINILKNICIIKQNSVNDCVVLPPKIYKKKMNLTIEEQQQYQQTFNKITNKLNSLGEKNE